MKNNPQIYNLGVVGHAQENSFLPQVYAKFITQTRIESGFNVFDVYETAELPIILHFLERFSFHGLNIASPHKQAIIQYLKDADEIVQSIGAANTVIFDGDGWIAYNTETYGFGVLLDTHKIDIENKNILIFGAGSACRALLYTLRHRGCKSVSIANRSKENFMMLKDKFADMDLAYHTYQSLREKHTFDIVINATPVDWTNKIWLEHFWAKDEIIFAGNIPEIAIDLAYPHMLSGFLSHWKSPKKHDGFAMLAAQAAKSFEIWFNVLPKYSLEN